jgi:hypothetical protein
MSTFANIRKNSRSLHNDTGRNMSAEVGLLAVGADAAALERSMFVRRQQSQQRLALAPSRRLPTPPQTAPRLQHIAIMMRLFHMCVFNSLHGHQHCDGGVDRFLCPLKCFVQSVGRRTGGRLNLSLSLPEKSGH